MARGGVAQQQHPTRQHRRRTASLWSGAWNWKTLLMISGLIQYIAWVITLVVCSSPNNPSVGLAFPLDVYAWSVGQVFSTLGIFRPLAKILTQKAWESFERRQNIPSSSTVSSNETRAAPFLPPTEIPVLDVQEFLHQPSGGKAALAYLRDTYGNDWRERPLLLKGLWTPSELLSSSSPKRRLTPEGLLTMTDLTVAYFTDARKVGALEPDAEAPVSEIVRGMIQENLPHKIGSQFLVQTFPELMDEVAPRNFVRALLGNHFSTTELMGGPHRKGKLLPGTTTVPVFIANTNPVVKKETQKEQETASNECLAGQSGNGNDDPNPSCPNPSGNDAADSSASATQASVPITGLHCEPIANVAVQLWGSRTWTLVDPHHSWKLRPSISRDGRSYYPSWVSPAALEGWIPRYRVTTTPGDAIWLPTWTYHKVEYTYYHNEHGNNNNNNNNINTNIDSDSNPSDDETSEKILARLHEHDLSIGASLFHFRPVDYFRRNPLFAVLLIPSLVRELLGIKTQ